MKFTGRKSPPPAAIPGEGEAQMASRTLWIRFKEWSSLQREEKLRRMEKKLSGGAQRLHRHAERKQTRRRRRFAREGAVVALLALVAVGDLLRADRSVIRRIADREITWERGWADADDRFPGLASLREAARAEAHIAYDVEALAPLAVQTGTNGLWE